SVRPCRRRVAAAAAAATPVSRRGGGGCLRRRGAAARRLLLLLVAGHEGLDSLPLRRDHAVVGAEGNVPADRLVAPGREAPCPLQPGAPDGGRAGCSPGSG
ncbi:unnamed protein product, partial [Ectocarpus sp. 13 AM-2016]